MSKLGYNEYFAKKSRVPSSFHEKYGLRIIIVVIIILIGFVSFFSYKYFKNAALQKAEGVNPLSSLFVDDTLSVYRFNHCQWVKLGGDFKIFQKDWFVTGSIPRTVLTFNKDNNIRVAPVSEMIYLSYRDDQHSMQLNQGKAFLETFEGKYMVYSSLGSIFMESGKVLVDFDSKGLLRVACFNGKASVVSTDSDSAAVSLLPGEKVFINKKRKISSISKIDKKDIEMDKWVSWNLSFSGKGMKLGQEPPAFFFATKKDEVQMVFRQTENRIKIFQEVARDKKTDAPERKPLNYPKFSGETKIPAGRSKVTTTPEKPPSIPEDDIKRGKAHKTDKPGSKPDDSESKIIIEESDVYNYEEYLKEEMDRKHKGAFYYTDNERRRKENPVSVPGYNINTEPIGPSER